jgi:hypothetical protein
MRRDSIQIDRGGAEVQKIVAFCSRVIDAFNEPQQKGESCVRETEGRPEDEMTEAGQVLRPEMAPGSDPGKTRTVRTRRIS